MANTTHFPPNLTFLIQKLREKKIYLKQLGEELGIDNSSIYRWRMGERDISKSMALLLVQYFNKYLNLKLNVESLMNEDIAGDYEKYVYQEEDFGEWIDLLKQLTGEERRGLKIFLETMAKRG